MVYDRSCDFEPFIFIEAANGNEIANNFLSLDYIVDVFHAEKHTEPKCVLGNADCKYHPDLEKFAYVRDMNTEIAEQSFHILNPLKHITRNMTYARRLCLLKIVDHDFNSRLTKNQC